MSVKSYIKEARARLDDGVSNAALRQALVDNLATTLPYLEAALHLLSVGDDVGAGSAIKKAAAHFGFAVQRLTELNVRNNHQKTEEAYALAPEQSRPIRDSRPGTLGAKPNGHSPDDFNLGDD